MALNWKEKNGFGSSASKPTIIRTGVNQSQKSDILNTITKVNKTNLCAYFMECTVCPCFPTCHSIIVCDGLAEWQRGSFPGCLTGLLYWLSMIRQTAEFHKNTNPVSATCALVFCCGLKSVHFTDILQGYFTGIWLLQCQWSNPEGYSLINHTNSHINNTVTKTNKQTHILWDVLFTLVFPPVSMLLSVMDWRNDTVDHFLAVTFPLSTLVPHKDGNTVNQLIGHEGQIWQVSPSGHL